MSSEEKVKAACLHALSLRPKNLEQAVSSIYVYLDQTMESASHLERHLACQQAIRDVEKMLRSN